MCKEKCYNANVSHKTIVILDNGRTSSTKWSKKFNPYQSCIIGIMNHPHFHQARVWNGHNDIICDKKTALSFSALDTYFCKSTANVFHFHACRVAINTSRQFFFLSVAHNQNLNSDKFTNISCKQSSIIICTVWMTSSCDYSVTIFTIGTNKWLHDHRYKSHIPRQ